MAKKEVVKNIRLELEVPDPPSYLYTNSKLRDQYYEREARELEELILDHRSCDQYYIKIVKDIETVCEFCGNDWWDNLEHNGRPACCNDAINEWEKTACIDLEGKNNE